jgi:retron-type reverse transcriptase
MIRHEVSQLLVDSIEDMLVGRNLIVHYGYITTVGKPDRGCPQGRVLSPFLCCLMVNDLLLDLQKEGFHIYGYADEPL